MISIGPYCDIAHLSAERNESSLRIDEICMMPFVPPCPLSSPVLFLVFNRPDTTAEVFDAIRRAQPARLYIAADGPRANPASDREKCEQVKNIVSRVDWPCEVRTLFRMKNLGCGTAISSAISWFFEHEAEGIILEDDCLPSQSFFWYCQELLERYRDDTRIMHIGGNNFLNGWQKSLAHSYYFALNGHIWGWATWRRAWKYYDLKIARYHSVKHNGYFEKFFLSRFEKSYRLRKFNQVSSGKINTWDYQWDFARYINSGLSIVPTKNLVRNLGFGNDATHARGWDRRYATLEASSISLPLRHPPFVLRNVECEQRYFSMMMKDILISKLTPPKMIRA